MSEEKDVTAEVKANVANLMKGSGEEVVEETLSDYEEAAVAEGWKPKDQYEGNPKDWVDADEFMRRKPLFDKIHNQSRELKKIKEALNVMGEHHKRVYEDSYKQALRELQAQRIQAVEEGDAITVMELDKAINNAEQDYKEKTKSLEVPQGPAPDFEDWVQENDWYKTDPRLRARADELGVRYAQSNTEASNMEVYEYVTERIRMEYPQKFEQDEESKPATKRVGSVERGNNIRRNTRSKSVQLTPVEQQVMRTLVAAGTMTEEQYKAEIAKLGDR